jgi:anti-sigma factor ChrR (cupin superfamily)
MEDKMLDMIINCNEMDWQDAGDTYPKGTKIKVLCEDEGGKTVILNLPRGFKMERHSHLKMEQHYILKGQYEINGKEYKQSTYQLIHPKMFHGPITSAYGAEVLIVWH